MAFVDISFGKFAIALCNLFESGHWDFSVVSDKHTSIVAIVRTVGFASVSWFAIGTQFWVGIGAAVWEEAGIVKAAIYTVEGPQHTRCVGSEF